MHHWIGLRIGTSPVIQNPSPDEVRGALERRDVRIGCLGEVLLAFTPKDPHTGKWNLGSATRLTFYLGIPDRAVVGYSDTSVEQLPIPLTYVFRAVDQWTERLFVLPIYPGSLFRIPSRHVIPRDLIIPIAMEFMETGTFGDRGVWTEPELIDIETEELAAAEAEAIEDQQAAL